MCDLISEYHFQHRNGFQVLLSGESLASFGMNVKTTGFVNLRVRERNEGKERNGRRRSNMGRRRHAS